MSVKANADKLAAFLRAMGPTDEEGAAALSAGDALNVMSMHLAQAYVEMGVIAPERQVFVSMLALGIALQAQQLADGEKPQ